MKYEEQEAKFKSHPKVIEAKKLMNEAWDKIRMGERGDRGKDECKCGHKREDHNPSTNINYTQGNCRIEGCKCLWYLHAKTFQE